ncbi:MAG: ABC transporter, partial [Planctomycetes bacterium]|nr:ABC transporter [Planctomycetota bacterium]
DADIGRGANEALALAMVQWLAGREETRDLPPRPWRDRRLPLTGAQLRGILWVAVVGMPLAWLLAGISAWWLRRD